LDVVAEPTRPHERLFSPGSEIHLVGKEGVGSEDRMVGAVVKGEDSNTSRVELLEYRDGLVLQLYSNHGEKVRTPALKR